MIEGKEVIRWALRKSFEQEIAGKGFYFHVTDIPGFLHKLGFHHPWDHRSIELALEILQGLVDDGAIKKVHNSGWAHPDY